MSRYLTTDEMTDHRSIDLSNATGCSVPFSISSYDESSLCYTLDSISSTFSNSRVKSLSVDGFSGIRLCMTCNASFVFVSNIGYGIDALLNQLENIALKYYPSKSQELDLFVSIEYSFYSED